MALDTRIESPSPSLGERLRGWRERRHLSQMALALRAEVSARHLSFVETGRAQPGRELVLRLADELEVPLRDRNVLLMSGGFAPVFEQRAFDDPAFDPVRAIIDITLERNKPYPAYAIDRHWNVVRSNAALPELYEGVDAALMAPRSNMVRILLHPRGMAPRIRNLTLWRAHLIGQIRRQLEFSADPQLEALLRETLAYPAGDDPSHEWTGTPAMPLEIDTRLGRLSLIGVTTVFGTPVDVTLEEIALEVLHPADEATDRVVRAAASARRA